MAEFESLKQLLKNEIKQRSEEGCNTQGFYERLEICPKDKNSLDKLYDELMSLEISKSFSFSEPNELAEIRAEWPSNIPTLEKTGYIEQDFFYGAWLGRCCGCALGKPFETGPFIGGKDDIPGWKLIYEWFKGADAYPIKDYGPAKSTATETFDIKLNAGCSESLRENIRFMQTDDDIRFTVLGLVMLEEKGLEWDPLDVGVLWHDYLPLNMVFTAERQAYLNFAFIDDLRDRDDSPEHKMKLIDWVRTYRNPYREWIGAQIRVDGYAYGAAGNPDLAAELAWRDSSFSHVKNGIYGAMFCSAMIAAAFVEKDNMKIVEAGLARIPKNSRLARDIKTAIEITVATNDQLELVAKIWEAFKHYHPVHTNNNAALCTAAILFAGDDFEKAITTAVLGGWDTDCNGATVGSIMGAKLGASGIPKNWSDPLNDTLYSAVPGFHPIAISECAERSYNIYKKFR